MLTRSWPIFVLVLAVLAFWGCAENGALLPNPLAEVDDGNDTGGGVLPTLASIQENLFTPHCATSGCHNGTPGNPMKLDSEDESYKNLVLPPNSFFSLYCDSPSGLVPRVDAGDPDNSCLVMAIEGTAGWSGPNYARMPPPPAALSQDEIDAIRQWIEDGALPEAPDGAPR